MPAAEDRQAKALEGIHYTNKELVKVMTAVNGNLLAIAKIFKNAFESTQETHPNQMSLDDIRIKEEKARAERAEYESRTGEMWLEYPDPIQDKVNEDEFDRANQRGEGSE